MSQKKVRTRFAPSPTGFMHIGNLRTALYSYLIARASGGKFVLRVEDTDQGRLVQGAEDAIFRTLNAAGLRYDEGPGVGGAFGPYVQSERKDIYGPLAEQLVREGKAYRCFCSKKRLGALRADGTAGYDGACRNLTESELHRRLENGETYVVRQKIPDGKTSFNDAVFGEICIENSEIEDQILLKSDGFPTYNFANVVDDHLMEISHVVRGCEYLTSTPKYALLYEAFGWEVPVYVHLPLILGQNEDGSVEKLSKRHGAVSFEDLARRGYLPEAIVNFVALLGWSPAETREIFTLSQLEQEFSIERIGRSPAVFDFAKLDWMNGEYLRAKPMEKFFETVRPALEMALGRGFPLRLVAETLQARLTKLSEIPEMVGFLRELPEYDAEIFYNKKSKVTPQNTLEVLRWAAPGLETLPEWTHDALHSYLAQEAAARGLKNGAVMWPVRVAVSGKAVTPGGATEILEILGRDESLRRMKFAVEKLQEI